MTKIIWAMPKYPCFLLVFISCPCSFKLPIPHNSRLTSREKIILRISQSSQTAPDHPCHLRPIFYVYEIFGTFQMVDYLMLDLRGRKTSKDGFRFFDLLPATWSKLFDGSSQRLLFFHSPVPPLCFCCNLAGSCCADEFR